MGSINENACMLGGDDGVDNGRQVVNIGQSFYTENDVVECAFFASGSFFWCADDCGMSLFSMRSDRKEGGRGPRAHTVSGLEPLIAKDGRPGDGMLVVLRQTDRQTPGLGARQPGDGGRGSRKTGGRKSRRT